MRIKFAENRRYLKLKKKGLTWKIVENSNMMWQDIKSQQKVYNALVLYCKVEFNQPFCWLYSVPNLFVIQHLETLYLCGNYVSVVCERV